MGVTATAEKTKARVKSKANGAAKAKVKRNRAAKTQTPAATEGIQAPEARAFTTFAQECAAIGANPIRGCVLWHLNQCNEGGCGGAELAAMLGRIKHGDLHVDHLEPLADVKLIKGERDTGGYRYSLTPTGRKYAWFIGETTTAPPGE